MGNKQFGGGTKSATSGGNPCNNDLKRALQSIKNLAGTTELITKEQFLNDVFGGFLPFSLGNRLFDVFGGSKKGITTKDLVDGLSIFVTNDSRTCAKFVYRFYVNDLHSDALLRDDFFRKLRDDQGHVPAPVVTLFENDSHIDFAKFSSWLENNPDALDLHRFLIQGLSLTVAPEKFIPSFHQVLTGITHFTEENVASLEKTFWQLVNASDSRQFDCPVFVQAVSPPLSPDVAKLLFLSFDDRKDGVVDLRELAAGISACCYGPVVERTKFIFRLFDVDEDGLLKQDEIDAMLTALLKSQVLLTPESPNSNSGSVLFLLSDISNIRDNILNTSANLTKESATNSTLNLDQFLQWTLTCSLHQPFLELLFQVCHVAFGVKPREKKAERSVVRSYLDRRDATELIPGDVVYLIPLQWWSTWCSFVGLPVGSSSTRTLQGITKLSNKSPVTQQKSQPEFQSSKQFYERTVGDFPKELSPAGLMTEERKMNGVGVNSLGANSLNKKPLLRVGRFNQGSFEPTGTKQHHQPPVQPGHIDNALILSNAQGPSESNKICLTSDMTKPLRIQMAPFFPGYGFEILPPSVWLAFQSWYGLKPGTLPVSRRVVVNSETSIPEIEYQPVRITFLRRAQQPNGPASNATSAATAVASLPFGFGSAAASFVKSVFGATSVCTYPASVGPYSSPTVSTTVSTAPNSSEPVSSHHNVVANSNKYYDAAYGYYSRCHTLGDVLKSFMTRFHLNPDLVRLWHLKSGHAATGKRALIWQPGQADTTSIAQALLIPSDNLSVLDFRILIEVASSDLSWPEDAYLTTHNSNSSLQQADLANGSSSGSSASTQVGLIGFQNLGNTCFLNAALQCLSNTPSLTKYFLRRIHLHELNMANPLGFHGLVALRYAELIEMVWSDGSPKSNQKPLSPAKIKNLIAKTWSQFGDNDQQDATELMTFLLDGLHEDLNRKRRPVAGNGNGTSQLANGSQEEEPKLKGVALAWWNHLKMNDSIVVDLFHGLLSSEITCPACRNSSRTYDPFSSIVLPLPVDPKLTIELTVIFLDTTKQPLRIAVRVPTSSACPEIYRQSGKVLFGKLPKGQDDHRVEERFLLAEISQASVIRFYGATDSLGKVFGELVLYEIIGVDKLSSLKYKVPNEDDSSHFHAQGHFGKCQEERCRRRFSLYDQLCVPLQWQDRFFIVINRQLVAVQNYILPQLNWRPQLFGRPLLIPVPGSANSADTFERCLYNDVWERAQRYLTPNAKQSPKFAMVPNESGGNYARDGDYPAESNHPFPFELSRVAGPSCQRCSRCPWNNFCRGCSVSYTRSTSESPPSENMADLGGPFLAIDWDPRTIFLFFSHNVEAAFQLDKSVEICRQKSVEPLSLYDCLVTFSQNELIDGYACEKKDCPSKENSEQPQTVTASSHMSLARLPPMLIVHLKRYFNARDGRWLKSSRKINVPIDNLNLTEFMANEHSGGDDAKQIYKLYAAVCHYGAMRSGHYVTYAKHQPSGVWYFFDDTSVREVQPSEIDMSAVYLLFFECAGLDYDSLLPDIDESRLPTMSAVDALRTAELAEEQRLSEAKSRGTNNGGSTSGSSRCTLQ